VFVVAASGETPKGLARLPPIPSWAIACLWFACWLFWMLS
jgi:hypothetical protein